MHIRVYNKELDFHDETTFYILLHYYTSILIYYVYIPYKYIMGQTDYTDY